MAEQFGAQFAGWYGELPLAVPPVKDDDNGFDRWAVRLGAGEGADQHHIIDRQSEMGSDELLVVCQNRIQLGRLLNRDGPIAGADADHPVSLNENDYHVQLGGGFGGASMGEWALVDASVVPAEEAAMLGRVGPVSW